MKNKLLILLLIFLCGCTKNNSDDISKESNQNYIKSSVDFNENSIDDYTDLLNGARKDAINHPTYDPAYVVGGYPEDDKGVCTDLVWRAFKEAGYDLKSMVDSDISKNKKYYQIEKPDPNIDFRRVPNLHKFFKKYATSLTTDINKYEEFNPGDIITYLDKPQHIGIVSDKKNSDGRPLLIHNAGQSERENDGLDFGKIHGHFRFDASKIDKNILKAFKK